MYPDDGSSESEADATMAIRPFERLEGIPAGAAAWIADVLTEFDANRIEAITGVTLLRDSPKLLAIVPTATTRWSLRSTRMMKELVRINGSIS